MNKVRKKIFHKIFAYFLIGTLFFSSMFYSNTFSVQAISDKEKSLAESIVEIIALISGVVAENPVVNTVVKTVGNAFISLADMITDNGDGTVTIDEELVTFVQSEFDKQQEATEIQYTFYTPPSISSVSSAHFIDLKHYDACKSLVTQYGGASNVHYLSSDAGRGVYVFDSSSFYYSINSPSIYDQLVTTGEIPTNAYLYPYTFNFVNAGNAGLVSSATYDSIACNYKITPYPQYFGFEPYNGLVSASGSPIMIFRTIDDLKRFLNLESNIYRGHSTYNGGVITVPASALQVDYSKLYDTVSDNINNTDSPTPEDIQQIVDDAIEKALEDTNNSGSGGDSGNGSGDTVSGGDSGGSGGSGGGLGAFLDGLGHIGDAVLSILGKLLEYIGKALQLFTDTIDKAIQIIPTGFTKLLVLLFPFFPQEWVTAVEISLVLGILLAVVRAFKK